MQKPPERRGLPGEQLDITSLANVVTRLREGLERHRLSPGDKQLRDGLIQRFEFTYEVCHRMVRRFIRLTAALQEEVTEWHSRT